MEEAKKCGEMREIVPLDKPHLLIDWNSISVFD